MEQICHTEHLSVVPQGTQELHLGLQRNHLFLSSAVCVPRGPGARPAAHPGPRHRVTELWLLRRQTSGGKHLRDQLKRGVKETSPQRAGQAPFCQTACGQCCRARRQGPVAPHGPSSHRLPFTPPGPPTLLLPELP